MATPDAGLKGLDHYRRRLPAWRYIPRQWLLPLIRWETPYLAALQDRIRSPALDSYFAITANLGTHTFFMVVLPILFWCGYTGLGRAMIHILASGVFLSGFVKDLLCLPRPLSPPLQRITMSGSAALEYGFPSTHSTNAVSIAVYALLTLKSSTSTISPIVKLILQVLAYFYAFSIVVGRILCGMHGFSDVIVGSCLGALLSLVEYSYVEQFDSFVHSGSSQALFIVVLSILVLVRIHPEPADDCPCFDDSVAFAGVMCGAELGNWHFAQSPLSWAYPVPATVPFHLGTLGWTKVILRIFVGVGCIFAWRGVMKSVLLKGLPPVFRIIERLGLSLPRRFFMKASQYKEVPQNLKTDNVIPSVSDFPNLLAAIRHPRRSRSISVGPQSEADAYEILAFRQQRRRESLSSLMRTSASDSYRRRGNSLGSGTFRHSTTETDKTSVPSSTCLETSIGPRKRPQNGLLVSDALSVPGSSTEEKSTTMVRSPSQIRRQDEKEDNELFSHLEVPRVRYDVEVITKLIVYSGIAWMAVEGNPILFHYLGLSIDSYVSSS